MALQLMSNLSTLVTGTRPARFIPAEVLPLLCPSPSAVSCKREVKVLQCGPLGTVVSPPLPPTRIVLRRKSIAMVACPRFAGETGRLPDAHIFRSAYFVIVVGAERVTVSLARMAHRLYSWASLSVAGSRLVLQDVKLKFTTQNAQLVS